MNPHLFQRVSYYQMATPNKRLHIERTIGDTMDYIPTLTNMADYYRMSESTLKRRLRQEGTTYRKILRGKLSEKAIHMLLNSNKTIAEVAKSLGYASSSSFIRAFRRWQGVSPSSYRKGISEGILG